MSQKRQAHRFSDSPRAVGLDPWLVLISAALLAIGVVMVTSTSIIVAEGYGQSRWHYVIRHLVFIGLGVGAAGIFRWLEIRHLEKLGVVALVLALIAMALPFVPGLGHTVNGSTRWVKLGIANFQVVEAAKVLLIIFVASFLAKQPRLDQAPAIYTFAPLIVVAVFAGILLKQPDLGSIIVIGAVVLGMIWLAGAAVKNLSILALICLPAVTFATFEPYRWRRMVSFIDPWADPFNAGFQLTQALIAIGRGEIGGVGLGGSIQKLFYLPEAHTDFIFAVYAEEFGLIGIVVVLALFGLLVGRMLHIGLKAHQMDKPFAALCAWGVGLWLGFQAVVSMGVNLGVLPTKGLTLPLISSGGSSILMTIFAIGLVLRIQWELQREQLEQPRRRQRYAV